MKVLKGLALSLLSLLLFLSLTIFGLAFMLNSTLLKPDFVVSEINRLDIPSLAEELLSKQIPEEDFPAEFRVAVVNTITDLEPWIKEQTAAVIYSGYDYLKGKSQSLSLVISLEPAKEKLRDNLWEAYLQSPPPELAGASQAELEQDFNEFYQEFSGEIPSTFEITESLIPAETLVMLEQVRQGIDYFQLGYKILIGFMVALVVGIIFIHRQVKGATRGLGITFLTFGAFEYAGIFVAKYFAGTQLASMSIPTALQAWLPQFLNNFLAPLEMFSLGLLIGGVVLIVVSFVYKPRQPSPISATETG